MKQIQFAITKKEDLIPELKKISLWCNSHVISKVVFFIYSEIMDNTIINGICKTIDTMMPDALYLGCSSNGNIINGDFSIGSICVVCTIYEYPTTKIKHFQYELNNDNITEIGETLVNEVNKLPWVKGVGLVTSIRGMSMTPLCEALSNLREDVQLVGGAAFAARIDDDNSVVFSKEYELMEKGIVFWLFGGDDLFFESTYVTGWKPLSKELLVTKARGYMLEELNHRPAYETYYKYLHIKNDEHFFNNTLEFPFIYKLNGIDILRAPTKSNPDGSLTMTADINQDVTAQIAYGDPWTILKSVNDECLKILDFGPEAIFVYSCAARRTFWGNDEVGKETLPLNSIAPTSGFYTSGEFIRTGHYVNQHNVTLVILSVREGEKKDIVDFKPAYSEDFEGKISMISRLATFIKTTTAELNEANKQLEIMAITDGLSGIFNRREIQRRITNTIDINKNKEVYLIMLDIDDFKKVNDKYGHDVGDKVIIKIADILLSNSNENISAGRWGGEEFMVLVNGKTEKEVVELAEKFRTDFSAYEFEEAGHITCSLGITKVIPGEHSDSTCSRVDDALYKAKSDGKNRVTMF